MQLVATANKDQGRGAARIKVVSADESQIGHSETVAKIRELADDLKERLDREPVDRLVGALGGRMLSLDDFCRTRLIEVLLHMDDLAVSVGEVRPETDPEGPAIAIDILTNIAKQTHGEWSMIYALARAERSSGTPVFPVF